MVNVSQTFDFAGQLSTMARERLEGSVISEVGGLVAANQAISFGAGEPSPELLPLKELKEAFESLWATPAVLSYAMDERGYMPLREWIVDRMFRDDISPDWVNPEHVLLTSGGAEAVHLASEALIDPGSLVLVEAPTYVESLITFRKQGAVCVPVESDDEGILPEALQKFLATRSYRFLYTIPNFQNPSGRTTTLERRQRILAIARQAGLPILEDDPYHYLNYEAPLPPSYLKLAGDDQRVIHCNSFSKIIAPGIRTGWMVVPPVLCEKMSVLALCSALVRPLILQRGLHEMLCRIDFEERIRHLCQTYKVRRDTMFGAMDSFLTPLGIKTNRPKGGFFVWGEMPGVTDMVDFMRYTVQTQKVGIIPGSAFFPSAAEGAGTFRLSYAKVEGKTLEQGIERLALAYSGYRK